MNGIVDFTSALYLGWEHSGIGRRTDRFEALTLGKPAALEEPPGSRRLAEEMASLTGFEAGLTSPSTLHLALDVSMFFAAQGVEFFADNSIYPIGRRGLEIASARDSRVQWFQHHNPESLRALLRSSRRAPVVVSDGFCPACGSLAPLDQYQALIREKGGWLLADDTQALGILGKRSSSLRAGLPYGQGGGGSRAFLNLRGEGMIVICSLAKAFGTPLAAVLGSSRFIGNFADASMTRLHCSPPSTSAIRTGLHALDMNRHIGDRLRQHLFKLVIACRRWLLPRGWRLADGLFPVQAIDHTAAPELQRSLLSLGVKTLLQRSGDAGGTRLAFVLNASHQLEDVARLVRALDQISEGRVQYERDLRFPRMGEHNETNTETRSH
jgi:8-amino-7-oxononanoate synthase